jgi:hypothetical protein
MRYVIVDMDGASRDYFSRRKDVRDALRELEGEHPGIVGDLLVVTYGNDGQQIGKSEAAVEVLAAVPLEPMIGFGASATRLLVTDLWAGMPTAPVATMASGHACPVMIPSASAPMRPYEYGSGGAAVFAPAVT